MITTAILAWLHVFSAIAWFGGGIVFGFVIAPALSKLSPASSGEFFLKIVPRVVRFFEAVSGSTILFGVLLVYVGTSNGDFPGFSQSSTWSFSIMIGLTLGLIAFLVGELAAGPAFKNAVKAIRKMQEEGLKEPPPELGRSLSRARTSAMASLVLLTLTLVFMIAAGFY